ncbi:MAG: hypothetical protein WC798_00130 [Candidatus Paceibacterota bacterium]|jgi:hypothetical protein
MTERPPKNFAEEDSKKKEAFDSYVNGLNESVRATREEEEAGKQKKEAYDSYVKGLEDSIHTTREEADAEKQKKEAYDSYVKGLDDSISARREEKIGSAVEPEPEIIKDVIEPEEVTPSEGTPREWRTKLRELITGAKESVKETAGSVSELFIKSGEYFSSRSEELNAEAKKTGVEGAFRWMGEAYGKLSTREKIGIGLALGLGAGGLAAVSLPVSYAFLGGISVQRTFGLASNFLKYEKSSSDREWFWLGKKGKAMGKAVLYQTGMTAGMLMLVEGVKEGTEWLSHHWPGHPATGGGHAPAGPHAPEHAPVAPQAPKMPDISVEASKGRGYEWMVKRMWEQINEHRDQLPPPSKIPAGSDLAKLYYADSNDIDKIVHDIASDPKHGFFNTDGGTSVQVNMDDKLSLGADGQIHLGDTVHAPEGAHVTPAYPPEAAASVEPPVTPPAPEVPAPPVEAPAAPPAEAPAVPPSESPAAPEPPAPIEEPDLPVEAPAPEMPVADVEPAVREAITNQFGVPVAVDQPHFYADAKGEHIFVFGGSPTEKSKAVLDYLTANPNQTVYSSDDTGTYRVPWTLVGGEVTLGKPVETGGFLGFFKSFMGAPKPDEFGKLIK